MLEQYITDVTIMDVVIINRCLNFKLGEIKPLCIY